MALVDLNKWLTVNPKVGVEAPAVQRINKVTPQEQGIAAQNRELAPNFLNNAESGSYFTNGLGHYKFGQAGMRPFLA